MNLVIIRTIILYFLTLAALKAMGKRQVGELQPSELVIVLIISEMASVAMENNSVPILNSIIPIIVLAVLQIILSLLDMKSEKLRDWINGHPSIVIKNGEVSEKELKKLRMNLNDLEEQLRSQGYFNINEIEYCLMETNGKLSVMPQTPHRPLTVSDLKLDLPNEKAPCLLILDGHVNHKAMLSVSKNDRWLEKTLREHHIDHPNQVFLAGLDSNGNFFLQRKDQQHEQG